MKQAEASMKIDIGIDEKQREKIASGLARLLADSYTLYLKTHNFHWNVTGPMFNTLHLMFETQYNELALAVDEIAERMRALGAFGLELLETVLELGEALLDVVVALGVELVLLGLELGLDLGQVGQVQLGRRGGVDHGAYRSRLPRCVCSNSA